jgi:tetratricopeptide (TPR) repeat protein/serine/threonine protein kinase
MNDASPEMLSLFCGVLERSSADERAAYLDAACGEDRELRVRIEALLRAHEQASGFLGDNAEARDPCATADAPIREGPGTVIGPYKLLEQIGEGGFGVVFLAEQTQPVRRMVALKVLKPGMDTRHVVARFEAERQALALMDHPNIAKVFDGGATASCRPYFVMELVKGVSITAFCDQHQLTPRQRLELFLSVCQAVQHAHQKGIIHRDLKPSNVLVSRHDTTPMVKVIDFGVAKALAQQLTDKTCFTGIAQMIGTPLYMSPEQAGMSDLDIDTRSDVYALGVLLYELLTGMTPFDQERLRTAGYDEIRRIIREEEPPRPSTRLSTIGRAADTVSANRKSDTARLSRLLRGELDWIVMKALEKDRNRRYESVNGLAQDVQNYLTDRPVLACPPSAGYRLRKFASRNRGTLALVACVFLGVMATAASFGWAVRDRVARQEESERVETVRRTMVAGQASDSLNTARALVVENKLAAARLKLATARAQLGKDWWTLTTLAAAVEAGEVELDRFQEFLALIDRAHELETAPVRQLRLTVDGSRGVAGARLSASRGPSRPEAAVPFLLLALQHYEILERGDWTTKLEGGLLGREQVDYIRRTAYEELLWLADDVVYRKREHRSGDELSPQAASRAGLLYLGKAEVAHRPTQAFYELRARCRQALGEEAAAQADRQLAASTPPTMALDHDLRGQTALNNKQFAEAISAFEAALRLEPTHYWSLMKLGYCVDLAQGPEHAYTAVAIFTGCILKRPDHAYAYYCRSIAYSGLNRHEDSLADCSKAIELDSTFALAWNNRGAAYADLGQHDKALADFSKAINLDPKFAAPWRNRGIAYYKLRQHDKAVADISRAIELDPKLAEAWTCRATAYCELNQYDKALVDSSKAIELDRKYAGAWCGRGIAYSGLGQHDKAIADLSTAIELNPKHVSAWANRGLAYSKLGQYDKAIADLSTAIELDPKDAAAWCNRGVAYSELGQHDKAIADCSKAIELEPKDATAWANRGRAYLDLDQPATAVVDCSKAIELNPKDATAWNIRGAAYLLLGQHDKAIDDCSKAIELDPKDAGAWSNRGLTYSELGQHDKAVADCSKAIELDPKDARVWISRSYAYAAQGQYDKTIADCTKAIELNPTLALAWYNRGTGHYKLEQHDKAIADFSKAIELDPKLAKARSNRGTAYHALGQHDKAIDDCSKAIELDPKLTDAWYTRGMAFLALNQLEKAIADFSKVIELIPKHRTAVAAYVQRADANSRAGHFAQAHTDLQSALKLAPADADIHNQLAWQLANCPEAKLRDPARAIELSKKSIELEPMEGSFWNTLGAAHYRSGDEKAAIAALNKSMELRKGGDAFDYLFLAMAHQKLGDPDEASKWYDRATEWLEKNSQRLKGLPGAAEEFRRLRTEAEEVLKLKKK